MDVMMVVGWLVVMVAVQDASWSGGLSLEWSKGVLRNESDKKKKVAFQAVRHKVQGTDQLLTDFDAG